MADMRPTPSTPQTEQPAVPLSMLGQSNGVATLDGTGKIPASEFPATLGVTSFDGRQGDVALTKADVTGTGIAAADVAAQPVDPDLTSIAALDSSTAGAIASDGAGWIKKTYAQLKAALGLAAVATSGDYNDLVNKPVVSSGVSAIFGDAADGNVTISTTVTLTRDMYYDTLTVANGGVLKPDGWRIFCKTKCDVQAGGKISADGGVGFNAGGGGPGNAQNTNRYFRVNGSNGFGGNGAAGAGSNQGVADVTLGGKGGNGGAGSGGAGGAAGATFDQNNKPFFGLKSLLCLLSGYVTVTPNISLSPQMPTIGTGGASGGGDGVNSGGGGGGAGGFVMVAAKTLNIDGTVSAVGGDGGTNAFGNTGGGGGGGGGVLLLTSGTRTGAGTTSTAAGNGAAGHGTGVAGANGNAGTLLDVLVG